MVVVLRCVYDSCVAWAVVLAGFLSGMRIPVSWEDGGGWASLSFFGFSEIEIFIFGGFELGLGTWASL
jgi:hypothetical protein